MTASDRTNQERARAAIGVAAVHFLLAFALLRGLGFDPTLPADDQPNLIELPPEVVPPPQPPPPPPSAGPGAAERRADPRPEGAASPPNFESRATPVVAPPPILPPVVPPPLPAATLAGVGSDPSAGAAKIAGPGTGSGGIGEGTGSGGDGDGAGGGGGGGYGDGGGLRPPRWLRGRLRNSDYPPGLGEAGVGGTVAVRYTVETDGSVSGCTVTRSSGSSILDRTTCLLIEQRFRFDPSRDRRGRPIRSQIVENHEWVVEDLPPEPDRRRPRRRLW